MELAQNAADAARATGVPGDLRVVLSADRAELCVANTGAPLDAAGVAALTSLRASAKRDADGAAGRFGVGFAAVLALTGEPRLVSGPGCGVRFSARDTAAAVGQLPGPAAELARREGHVPVLRLVWPVDEDEPGPPEGFATEVRLPLDRSVEPAAALLDAARAAAPDLLLALPALASITVGDETLTRVDDGPVVTLGGRRYLRVGRGGRHDTGALAAVEERRRPEWTLAWALPLDAGGVPAPLPPDAGEVLHAPTATGERLSLPARLVAAFPLEPDRRRVRRGPATDLLVREAADAYLELVRLVAPAHRAALVPEPGFPVSELDDLLRGAVLATLDEGEWLPAAAGGELAPRRAEWLDVPGTPGLPAVLAADPAFARLVAAERVPPALAVARLGAAGLAERLHAVEAPPEWWQGLYAALAPAVDAVPGLREELRALPVPLADGRLVAGPPSVLLPPASGGSGDPAPSSDDTVRAAVSRVALLGLPGLHVADPAAVHPLLARLGAGEAEPAALLAHPALREAVERSVDDADAGLDMAPLAEAVLGLLAVVVGPPRRLGALALPDSDGLASRADELMLPDAAVRPLLDPEAPVGVLDPGWAARFPRAALVAAGVLDGFTVVGEDPDDGADPAAGPHDLHDGDLWWDSRADDGPGPVRIAAVRDLDLVADDAWPAALRLLAAEPETRAAVLTEGGYTSWWLRRHALLGGRPPGHWRVPSAQGLAGLYDPVPGGPDLPDEAVLAAAGVRTALAVADTLDAAHLLARLADPARPIDAALVVRAHAMLAEAVADGRVDVAALELPERVRSLAGTVVAVDRAVVVDAVWAAAVLPTQEQVAGGDPGALAELLDLPLASEVVAGEVVGPGRPVTWTALPEVVVTCDVLGVPVPPGEVLLHDELKVALERPVSEVREVPAWPGADGRWHAADPVRALLARLADGDAEPGAVISH